MEKNWISVEDGLPASAIEHVLVAFDIDGMLHTSRYTYCRIGQHWYAVGVGYPDTDSKITHWQPLPEPPIHDTKPKD